MSKPTVAIVGGGPAGMIAADVLAPQCDVHVYEQGKSIGRKFLVAGQGGFNITNSAEGDDLLARYAPHGFMDEALTGFGPAHLRAWLGEMGIDTFVGTSGRVFPAKGIKPIDVLQAIRDRLHGRGVQFHLEHTFTGFDADMHPILAKNDGTQEVVRSAHVLFALGGASWPVTGSNGSWADAFTRAGIEVTHFRSSNCGVHVPWPTTFVQAHAGKPLKNIAVQAGDRTIKGEATVTEHGLEGNAIYPIVPILREALERGEPAFLHIDLKPNNTSEQLLLKLSGSSPQDYPKGLHLDRVQLAMVKALTPKERFFSPMHLVEDSKHLRVPVTALRPLDEAISTVGGIRPQDLDAHFALRAFPHLYTVGEMVDWDAPTGGFLLQGCFAMGHHAAQAILHRSGV